MNDLPVLTITQATEQAELRNVLILMTNGRTLGEACAEAHISVGTARKRMAQYPEVLSDFKRANEALMRGQLLNITQARDKVLDKLVALVEVTEDPETLMRINDHLTAESDRIQSALNADGASRDNEVKKILGIRRRPMESRMEITINLQGESVKNDAPSPVIIDGTIS